VLARVLWWRGMAWNGLPTVSSRRRRVVIADEGVSVEIGGGPVAGKHEWRLEKRSG
jgi:hypothetical protein